MVRLVDISVNDHQPDNVLRALRTGFIDAVQVIYNIFDQSPEGKLFAYCLQHDIGVTARVPFDEGSLTGRIRPEATFPDFRNNYFAGERKIEVWRRIQAFRGTWASQSRNYLNSRLSFPSNMKRLPASFRGCALWSMYGAMRPP